MKTWQIILLIAVLGAVIVGVILITNKSSDDNQTKSEQQNTNSADETSSDQTNSDQINNNTNSMTTANNGECVRNVDQAIFKAPTDIKNKFVTLTIKNYGDVKIQMYDKDAPKAVENFLRLSASGYYNCLTFHRMIPGFMIQGGDPTGNGTGGESVFGAKFADELDPNTPSAKEGYKHGVVAMANSGPNTNGSQFFIMLADYPLPHAYTIFGKVVSGLDVVDKVGLKGSESGQPSEKIQIEKAVVSNN